VIIAGKQVNKKASEQVQVSKQQDGRDEPSTSDFTTFDQNWHYLCPTSAGGKYLSK